MSFKEPVNDLERAAVQFHTAHPTVWRLVCEYAEQAKNRGFENYAIKTIWEVIRWHRSIERGPEDKTFKMSNSYHAYYARWYNMEKNGGVEFFREHRLRSLES